MIVLLKLRNLDYFDILKLDGVVESHDGVHFYLMIIFAVIGYLMKKFDCTKDY